MTAATAHLENGSSESAVRLAIISGPSGAGKSTVVRRLLEICPLPLQLSVSATTRVPREGEVDGEHYFFLSKEEFRRRQTRGDFLECNEVFGRGDWYGTLLEQVESRLQARKWVLLEIDVAGAMAVLSRYPGAVTFFVHSGSLEELDRRLRLRGTETPESLARRLEVAGRELKFMHQYRHQLVNNQVEECAGEICDILKSVERSLATVGSHASPSSATGEG